MMLRICALSMAVLSLAGCKKKGIDAPDVVKREQEVKQRIAAASGSESVTPVARWLMPEHLREISGIALTSDGRILAHNDENSRVSVIDPMRGVIVKSFFVGDRRMTADFEAIAVSGNRIFLLTSNGDIYEFAEGDEKEVVPFTKHVTGLGEQCEFESLEVEQRTRSFILVCKNISKKSERNQLLLFRWVKQDGGAGTITRISVPLAEAIGTNDWKTLSPSDIAIDPATGNYVIITGPEKALIEITPEGQVVQSMPLPGNLEQPEGVVVTRDGLFMVADEGVAREGDITIFSWAGVSGRGATPAMSDTTAADSTAAATN